MGMWGRVLFHIDASTAVLKRQCWAGEAAQSVEKTFVRTRFWIPRTHASPVACVHNLSIPVARRQRQEA